LFSVDVPRLPSRGRRFAGSGYCAFYNGTGPVVFLFSPFCLWNVVPPLPIFFFLLPHGLSFCLLPFLLVGSQAWWHDSVVCVSINAFSATGYFSRPTTAQHASDLIFHTSQPMIHNAVSSHVTVFFSTSSPSLLPFSSSTPSRQTSITPHFFPPPTVGRFQDRIAARRFFFHRLPRPHW